MATDNSTQIRNSHLLFTNKRDIHFRNFKSQRSGWQAGFTACRPFSTIKVKAGDYMKHMKWLLSISFTLCILLMFFASAFMAFAGEDDVLIVEYEAYYENPNDAEEPYMDGDTIHDFKNVVDTPLMSEEAPPPEDIIEDGDDADIYTSFSFDGENAAQLAGAEYVPDEIIIKFKEPWQVPGKEKQLRHEIEKVEKVGFVEELGLYVVRVDDLSKNPNAVLNRFKNNKYIEFVEPNYILKADYIPNDPNYKTQSATLTLLKAQDGWDIIKGDSGTVIAVVDSGVAMHSDLPPLLGGYSAVAGLSPNNDKLGHGTGVAGTIGMVGDNGVGGAGMNWSASILPVKIDDANGVMSTANVAKGIIWAADNGASIINLSLGSTADSITLKNAIDYAYNKGCAIFAASGNDSLTAVCYPARYPNVMAVGATANGTARVSWSNYGPGINVVANAGYNSTTPAGGYKSLSGTSLSTPQVAGLASLIWAISPDLTNEQVYRLIEQGAKTLGGGYNEQTGYGLIDIGNTLRLAQETAGDTDSRIPPVITLTGFAELTLEYGQAYMEMGYTATDCNGVSLTSAIKITNTVDIWKAGLYTVTYEVADSAGLTARATRTVTVSPQPADPPPPEAPKITIIGSNPIILHSGSNTPYTEQGARAIDHDGSDISNFVTIAGTVNRTVAGTYTLTYSVTSPATNLSASTTRNVRIVAQTEKRDPRTPYGYSGQSKQGGKITHTGIVSGSLGFIDLNLSAIDKNMTITVQLIDTTSKKAVFTDTFTAAGKKQYMIDQGKYELAVTVDKANGNGKYTINLLMPEAAPVIIYDTEEVPLFGLPQIALIGSNPIILHIGGTPYTEQGARAADYLGNDISGSVIIKGAPDTSVAGAYTISYTVAGTIGIPVTITREVRILDPNDETTILEAEVPMKESADLSPAGSIFHVVVKGDNLTRIAEKYYGDGARWREIYNKNRGIIGGNPNLIYPGQVLIIDN